MAFNLSSTVLCKYTHAHIHSERSVHNVPCHLFPYLYCSRFVCCCCCCGCCIVMVVVVVVVAHPFKRNTKTDLSVRASKWSKTNASGSSETEREIFKSRERAYENCPSTRPVYGNRNSSSNSIVEEDDNNNGDNDDGDTGHKYTK